MWMILKFWANIEFNFKTNEIFGFLTISCDIHFEMAVDFVWIRLDFRLIMANIWQIDFVLGPPTWNQFRFESRKWFRWNWLKRCLDQRFDVIGFIWLVENVLRSKFSRLTHILTIHEPMNNGASSVFDTVKVFASNVKLLLERNRCRYIQWLHPRSTLGEFQLAVQCGWNAS